MGRNRALYRIPPLSRATELHAEERQVRAKVTIIGAGNVGATAAQEVARGDYADVVLIDIVENLPQGKALDMNESGPVLGYEAKITGSNGYEESAGSDVIVVTSGKPRAPGMSRDDLVATNQAIVKAVTEAAIAQSPNAVVVPVTNPLDAMCHVAKAASGLPKERVVGMAGVLDTARFRASSRSRRERRFATSRRSCWEATAIRWCPSSRRRPSVVYR